MAAARASAQDLFEIQVYPYDTVAPGQTMIEFHTNFIPSGTRDCGAAQDDGCRYVRLSHAHI